VVRKLDIQYVWIDALCFVQDDINDWEMEANQMSAIFQNAYLTIAATAAKSASDGFLRRPYYCSLEMPFTVTKEGIKDVLNKIGYFMLDIRLVPTHRP
jgi:hypothetical protein